MVGYGNFYDLINKVGRTDLGLFRSVAVCLHWCSCSRFLFMICLALYWHKSQSTIRSSKGGLWNNARIHSKIQSVLTKQYC